MSKYLMIAAGGALGALARFWVAVYVGQRLGTRWPYGTFIVNLSGSFLVGLAMTVLTENTQLSPNWRYLLPIGFIGAYTTFSTFEYETLRALQDGQWLGGAANIVLSVFAGFMMVWLGVVLGKALA